MAARFGAQLREHVNPIGLLPLDGIDTYVHLCLIMGGHGSGRKPVDSEARAAALRLLAAGQCSPAELVPLVGLDRNTVHHWPLIAGLDWRRVRAKRVAALWRKEMRNGARLVEDEAPAASAPSKAGGD